MRSGARGGRGGEGVTLGASSRAEESSERRSKQRSASGGFCLADATTDSSCATSAPNRDNGMGSPPPPPPPLPTTPRFAMRGDGGGGGGVGVRVVWADGLSGSSEMRSGCAARLGCCGGS